MTAKHGPAPAPKGVGDSAQDLAARLDEAAAMVLAAAESLHEPGPALINTLQPIRWPEVAHQEIERLARALLAKGATRISTIDVARVAATYQIAQPYAQRFLLQAFARVMRTPLLQPKPPVPNAQQVAELAQLVQTFTNGDQDMLTAIARDAVRYNLLELAECLVLKHGAPAHEVLNAAGDSCPDFAQALIAKLEALPGGKDEFLSLDEAQQMIHGAYPTKENR